MNVKIIRYLYFRGFFNKLLEKLFPIYFYFGISKFLSLFPKDDEHYWEIGYKDYPLDRIRNDLLLNFKIIREERVVLAPYYYIFLLEVE